MDFSLTKKQTEALEQLAVPGAMFFMCFPEKENGYKPHWDYVLPAQEGTQFSDFKPIKLSTVDPLVQYGMVELQCNEGGYPAVAIITTNGRNYIKSLKVNKEERLDMEKFLVIHKLTYQPMQKQTKRKK